MMRNVLRKTIAGGLSVQTALKRDVSKMLCQRMLSKQETAHLILSLTIVSCSHMFARINSDDNQHLIIMSDHADDAANVVAGNSLAANNTSGSNVLANNTEGNSAGESAVTNEMVAKKSMVEMGGLRMDENHWINDNLHNFHESWLQHMTLRDICKKCAAGENANRRNKICSHLKHNYVPVFYPKIRPDEDGDDHNTL